MRALSREDVRSVDRRAIDDFGMTGLVLMENAGRRCAEIIHQLAEPGNMVIMAGLGNNGGDGFVIARHWELFRKTKPTIFLVAGPGINPENRMSSDARANYEILIKSGFTIRTVEKIDSSIIEEIQNAKTIVDAIFGTGARAGLVSPMLDLVMAANSSQALRIAIDIPTGLDCDTGQVIETCFCADHTLTLVALKHGFSHNQGPDYAGTLHVIDIGVPKKLLDEIED